jgi:hypothetical protein
VAARIDLVVCSFCFMFWFKMGCLKVAVLCSRVPLGWSLAHFILNAPLGWSLAHFILNVRKGRRVDGLFSLFSGGGWSGAGSGCPAIGV